ncbi:MAG: GNAT family N-acetyltransferase [archaeon]
MQIYQSAFSEPPWNETWTREQVIEDLDYALSQDFPVVLVAQVGENIVGFQWGYRLPDGKFPFLERKGEIMYGDDLAVLKEYRREGIATRLKETSFTMARQNGMEYSVLRTDVNNPSSMGLNKKLGYTPVVQNGRALYDPEFLTRIYLEKRL